MGKRISSARIRQAWLDKSMTSAEAAASVGLTRCSLQARAKGLDLPPRPMGRRVEMTPEQEAVFRYLWDAHVYGKDICEVIGIGKRCHYRHAARLGLKLRGNRTTHAITEAEKVRVKIILGEDITSSIPAPPVRQEWRSSKYVVRF